MNSPSARQLLERAKAAQIQPPAGMKARVKSAVMEAAALPSKQAPSKPQLRLLTKPWVSATLLTLAGFGALRGVSHGSRPEAAQPIAQAPPSAANDSEEPPAAEIRHSDDVEILQPTAATTVAPVQPRPKRVASSKADLRAEMEWLARAEAALRNGDAAAALTELRAGRARFARGQLQAERQGLELIARCTLGEDVHATLAQYIAHTPDGVLVDRALVACRFQGAKRQ
jgi:hypothetical protein